MTEPLRQSESLAEALVRVVGQGGVAALATIVEAPNAEFLVGKKLLLEEASGWRAGRVGDARMDDAVARQARLFLSTRAEACTYGWQEFEAAKDSAKGSEKSSEKDSAKGSEKGAESDALLAGARIMFERIEPEPHVVVCGAGHVGAALAHLAAAIGYRVTLVDDRADFLSRERFPKASIELVAARSWEQALGEVLGTGRGVSVAVVTRGHNEDEECMRAVLDARPDYVGMIGSRRRTNIVLARLQQAGYAPEFLREVRAPVGLDIGAVTPEEVALSILAEIIAHRRRGRGTPLSAWRREN